MKKHNTRSSFHKLNHSSSNGGHGRYKDSTNYNNNNSRIAAYIRSILPIGIASLCCYAFITEYLLLEKHYHGTRHRIFLKHRPDQSGSVRALTNNNNNNNKDNNAERLENDELTNTFQSATIKTTEETLISTSQSLNDVGSHDTKRKDETSQTISTVSHQTTPDSSVTTSKESPVSKIENQNDGVSEKKKERKTEDVINKVKVRSVRTSDSSITIVSSSKGSDSSHGKKESIPIDSSNGKKESIPIGIASTATTNLATSSSTNDEILTTYMKSTGFGDKMILLKWDKNGNLERTSPIARDEWFPASALRYFAQVKASQHGTAALLLNTNQVLNFPWNVTSPVPLLTYTLPNYIDRKNQNVIQVPNPFERDGFSRTLIWFANKVKSTFEQRKNAIIWRGNPLSLPLRMKILELSQNDPNNNWLDAASEDASNRMEKFDMAEFKYQLDIDGEAGATWSGLRWKMCSGNLVFKVESPYENWWYPTIEPWKHYIPIRSDLSDLRQQYEWAESHPEEVQQIRQQGQAICTYSTSDVKVMAFHRHVLASLKPVSAEIISEVNKILDGQGSFWENIAASKAFNSNKDTIPPEPVIPDGINVDRQPTQSDLISIHATPSTSIIRYLESASYPHMISLLKWNSSGILERVSPIDIPDWFPEDAQMMFRHIKPSKYGTVAFLLSTDVMAAVPWEYLPPIPFIAYTVPKRWEKSDKFFLVPNPYDRGGYNRACIANAETTTSKTSLHKRKNVLVWRGIPHGISDPNRHKLFEISKQDPEWIDAVNIDEDRTKYMTRNDMSEYKYQLDIGGESGTTWGSLRWKMCSGNLVFKVESWAKDWWHDYLQPWKHYIPVKEDLSDLQAQYEWAESHPDEVTEIVRQAVTVCKESVTEEAVETFQKKVLDSLPESSEALVKEADAVLDGLGSFYQAIIERRKTTTS